MGITVSPEVQLIFFEKLFSEQPQVVTAVKQLIQSGVKFEQAFFTVKASFNGKLVQQTTTASTNNLVKGTAAAPVVMANRMLVMIFLHGIWQEAMKGQDCPFELPQLATPDEKKPPFLNLPSKPVAEKTFNLLLSHINTNKIDAIKKIREIFNLGLKDAKDVADAIPVLVLQGVSKEDFHLLANAVSGYMQVVATETLETLSLPHLMGQMKDGFSYYKVVNGLKTGDADAHEETAVQMFPPAVPKVAKTAAKPIDKTIALKDASAIGQRVHGTSGGSVYHCIAIGDRVKVAAKILQNGSTKNVSIRIEANKPTAHELTKIKQSGISWKGDYGSLHLSVGDSSLGRAIGAFLMGMELKFNEKVETVDQLIINQGKG